MAQTNEPASQPENLPETYYIPAGVYNLRFINCKWEKPEKQPKPPEEKRDAA